MISYRKVTVVIAAALAVASCARPLRPLRPARELAGWPQAVDWRAAGAEAAQVLSHYLRVDTRNPPGNETRGARYLAALLQREGISQRIIEFAPGRGSLVARLRGSGAKRPLCLLSHIDVATADPREWPPGRGPLSGTIDRQGMIWGRGALDMKGMGAIELMTFIWLKRLEVPLLRDVILLAVADEEVGNHGMRQIVDEHWGTIRCSHMVNEGGLGLRGALFPRQTLFAISVAEKGVLWLRVTARGPGGHGSTPRADHAPVRLLAALQRIRRRVPRFRVHPSLEETFARIGARTGGVSGFVLRRPRFFRRLLIGKLRKNPGTRAALIDTVNITGFTSYGNQPNVVPARASALLDCRLLPGTTPEQIIAELRRLVGQDPAISFDTISYTAAYGSPWDDPFFDALARHVVGDRRDAVAGPVLSIGFTDSIYARRVGTRAYGLVPFEVTQEEAELMHAPGERVSTANVTRGLRVLFGAVLEVSAALDRSAPAGAPRRPPPFRPVPASALEGPAPSTAPSSAPASTAAR